MTLALSTLIYEWRRYLAAMFALAFSGVLILSQIGMFLGVGKAVTATIERSRADIIVTGPRATNLEGSSGVPRRLLPEMYMHPEVAAVQDMDTGGGRFQNIPAKGEAPKSSFVEIFSVDTTPGAVTLPVDFPESVRLALEEPYAVAIDRTALKKLGVKLGDRATLNGQTVKVRAVLTSYPNIFNTQIVSSRATLALLGQRSRGPRVGPLMVRLRNPARVEAVAADLNRFAHGRYRAWTKAELSKANQLIAFGEQAVGIMLSFSLMLGVLIGVAITWQTLRGAVFANIREFASLRALGVSVPALQRVVMELSFWVGLSSLMVTAALMLAVERLADMGGVVLVFTPLSILLVALFLVVTAVVSGMLSLGVLKHSQPSELLR